MIDPAQLRKNILAARNRLTPAEIADKSAAIARTLLDLEPIRDRQSIFVYVSFRSEVATREVIAALLGMGKTISVPITRVAEKRLDAIHIKSLEMDLEPGYCGIPEPRERVCLTREIAPAAIETIILPGSVFDLRGGRFGYGGGYYDRFLAKVPAATRIGLAFDLQIIDKAPIREHDELLDLVVTESRVIHGKR
jgi:5-formyltetrahydrofolate cyclo-ligase